MIEERQKTADLQSRLNDLGYGPLIIDGVYGKKTDKAYRKYLDEIDPDTPTVAPDPSTKWWMSRAFIGSGVVIIVGIAGIFGWEMDAEKFTDLVLSIVTVISGTIALIGTVKRKGDIDTVNVIPFKRNSTNNISNKLPSNVQTDNEYKDPRGSFGGDY